jgi:hypothetical protein
LAITAASALADSTHKYIESWNTPLGTQPQPTAVDDEGNLYVYNEGTNTVSRYDRFGDPVPFSALGTNTIDGKGFGEDCPDTPDDCDKVPTNGFGAPPFFGNNLRGQVAVDNSGGPADGYIYVVNGIGGPPSPIGGDPLGSIEVFEETGTWVGQIDKSVDGPTPSGPGGGQVSVDSNGHIFVWWPNLPPVIDEFVPIDGDPAHNNFRGQLYVGDPYPPDEAVGDNPYSYWKYIDWRKNAYSAYTLPLNAYTHAPEVQFPPDEPIFDNGGIDPVVNNTFRWLTIDPETHDVYLTNNGNGRIKQWDMDNNPIGPVFGPPYTGDIWKVAVDGSNGPHRGTVYTRGAGNEEDQIAVFSPPIPLPDVIYDPPEVLHTTAHLSATVDLAGGPPVTSCQLEWGTTLGYQNAPAYERPPVPCNEPLPYESEAQTVTADLSKLLVEQEFHYRLTVETENGVANGRNQNARTSAVLGVTTDPPTDVTKTSATLHGKLNPDNMATTYHFEYGATTNYGQETPEKNAPGGGSLVEVPGEPVSGLQPGRTYHVRLVASNGLGTTYGPDRTVVIPNSPSVFSMRTSNLRATSADLQAKVNPLGYDTTYRFEWGPSSNYGDATPDVELGAAGTPQDVETHVDDLEPGITYHFRVVATNQWGTTEGPDTTFSFLPPTCPNAHIRQQVGAHYLPDCRAYELVTPQDTEGTQILPGDSPIYWWNGTGSGLGSSASFDFWYHQYSQNVTGQAAGPSRFSFYASGGGLEGANVPNTNGDIYVATRSEEGWRTAYPGVRGDQYIGGGNPQCSVSLDQCLQYPIIGSNSEGERRDNIPWVGDTTTGELKGRFPSNYATVPDQREFSGEGRASGDFTHYAFSSLERLFAVSGTTEEPGSVYDNDAETDTVLVASKLPNGEPIPGEPGANGDGTEPPKGGFGFTGRDYFEVPAVSRDGSHILIGARTGPRCSIVRREGYCPGEKRELHLYMRVNAATTYDVSQGLPVFLLGMTENGSRVYFSTDASLDPADADTSVDIYLWSELSNDVKVISQGNGQGNSDDCSTPWTDQCDVQPLSTCTAAWTYQCTYSHELAEPHPFTSARPDIDTSIARENGAILFESPEQLDPSNPGLASERNLYLFRNGKVQYVTTFDPGSGTERFNITPSGRHVAFISDSQLTAYDNNSGPNVQCGAVLSLTSGTINTPCREMYSFDADTGDLRCVSCNPTGAPPAGDVNGSASGPFMTNDGRVFFNSLDQLVAGDTNGLYDVYEYVNGRPQLISTGTSEKDLFPGYINVIVLGYVFAPAYVGLEAVSGDGVDVYFSTYESLVPQDHNGDFVKIYDARTNGGIAYTPPPLPCPAADECHGDTTTVPAEPPIGTGAPLQQAANTVRTSKRNGKRRAKRRAQRKKRRRAARKRAAQRRSKRSQKQKAGR